MSIVEGIKNMLQGQFDAFLCYNEPDREAVTIIAAQLKKNGIELCPVEWGTYDQPIQRRLLGKLIARIRSVAVFVGRDGIGPWQRNEVEALLRELVRRGCPIVPVLLPNASGKPILPDFIGELAWVDFREDNPNPIEKLLRRIPGWHRELSHPGPTSPWGPLAN